MNDTPDELRRAVDFTFRALRDAATMNDRLEFYARADGDRATELAKQIRDLNARIDKVAEIIGDRIGELVDEIATLRDMFNRAETRTVNLFDRHSTDIASLLHPDEDVKQDGAAFPTGGAGTAEAAADAVLPVPQRGDRVRLEGAVTWLVRTPVADGWYDVIGVDSHTPIQIQVRRGDGALYWINVHDTEYPGLKEVRHADTH